ncbi:MAG: hypothetical protein ABIO16_00310 [Nocardioides sp.]
MSRYAVNSLMRVVNQDPPSLAKYVASPTSFVAEWLAATGLPLSDEERAALEERDYAVLYRMGAHPYLLWSFTEAVWVPELSRAELVEAFRASAREAGYPDWRTWPAPPLQ